MSDLWENFQLFVLLLSFMFLDVLSKYDGGPRHVDVSDNLRRGRRILDLLQHSSHHGCSSDIVGGDGPVEECDDDLLRDVRGDGGHPGHGRGGEGGGGRYWAGSESLC